MENALSFLRANKAKYVIMCDTKGVISKDRTDLNAFKAKHAVETNLKTLKEAVDAAFEAYSKEYNDAIYCIGSVLGPHPFPMMVRDFQSVVGIEAREQFVNMTGELPEWLLYHPRLLEWVPTTFIYVQQEACHDSEGNIPSFVNVPTSQEYYFEKYPLMRGRFEFNDEIEE